jgi:hypothetical protein
MALLGGRAGYRLVARGFLVEPFVALRGAAGWRRATVRVEERSFTSGRPLLGLGYGGGVISGRGALRLRLDVGGLWTGAARYYTTALALGYAIP